ncbi:MAG: response regulator, partial [Caldilineaceae bacterium]|nr:response regulator [Caldilineaceae bacterium]
EVQLVLLDVVMPGIDGNEVYRRIRQNDTALPIIMSSGYSADQIDTGVADDPNAFFLKKPYSIGDLIDMIAQMLAQQ